jgi:hypothetical protein
LQVASYSGSQPSRGMTRPLLSASDQSNASLNRSKIDDTFGSPVPANSNHLQGLPNALSVIIVA